MKQQKEDMEKTSDSIIRRVKCDLLYLDVDTADDSEVSDWCVTLSPWRQDIIVLDSVHVGRHFVYRVVI